MSSEITREFRSNWLMLVIALVILRTGLFMLLLAWAGLRQWRDFRTPSVTDQGSNRDGS